MASVSTPLLPELHLSRLAPDQRHAASRPPGRRQDPAGDHHAPQPLVERPAVRRCPWADDAAPAPWTEGRSTSPWTSLTTPLSSVPPMAAGGSSISPLECRSPSSTPASTGYSQSSGIDVDIVELPFGMAVKTPFPKGVEHASWDRDAIERFGRVLDWSDSVFEEFSGWFNGKTSPVNLFWHSLDLAVTRFSGRRVPAGRRRPGDTGGVFARGHLVRVLGWRRHHRRRRLLLVHRTRSPGSAPRSAAAGGRVAGVGLWGSLAVLPIRRRAPRARPADGLYCSPSARRRTRRGPAWPAGTPATSGRTGARPRLSFSSSSRMRAPTWGGRPRDPDPAHTATVWD